MKSRDKQAKRGSTAAELRSELETTQGQLFKLAFKHRVTSLGNPMQLKELRRHAARLKTWIREKGE